MNRNHKHTALAFTAFAAVALTACGTDSDDGDAPAASSSSVEASSSATDSISSSAVSSSSTNTSAARILVQNSDYSTGELVILDSTGTLVAGPVLNQDSRIVVANGSAYVLEAYGADNFTKLSSTGTGVSWQLPLAEEANPQDLVDIGNGSAWLVQTGTGALLRVDLTSGATLDSVDLLPYAAEGELSPNATRALASGDTLYIAIQRREFYVANLPGLIVQLNLTTGAVLDTLQLPFTNPYNIAKVGNRLLVSCSGSMPWEGAVVADSTRGVVQIHGLSGTSEVLFSDFDLGGSPQLLVAAGSDKAYLGVYKSFGAQPVYQLDFTSKTVSDSIPGVVETTGSLLAYDDISGLLYIGDRGPASTGLKIWNGTNIQAIAWGEHLPPYSIAILRN